MSLVENLEYWAPIIEMVLIFVLVGITFYYAKQTKKLFEEEKKRRELDFMERSLSEVLTPLITAFVDINSAIRARSVSELDISVQKAKEIYSRYNHALNDELAEKVRNVLYGDITENLFDEQIAQNVSSVKGELSWIKDVRTEYLQKEYPFLTLEMEE